MAKKALISVSDKQNIIPLAQSLVKAGYEILSTGGTASLLKKEGIPVILIEDYTGFPEILDGRVKTLQPKIHGGILANRTLSSHHEQMKTLGFEMIDIVIVNLYPFEETIAKEGVLLKEAVENIDIGGITLIRAAAKNFESVALICNPKDYPTAIKELEEKKEISLKTRKNLAIQGFSLSCAYDKAISLYFSQNL